MPGSIVLVVVSWKRCGAFCTPRQLVDYPASIGGRARLATLACSSSSSNTREVRNLLQVGKTAAETERPSRSLTPPLRMGIFLRTARACSRGLTALQQNYRLFWPKSGRFHAISKLTICGERGGDAHTSAVMGGRLERRPGAKGRLWERPDPLFRRGSSRRASHREPRLVLVPTGAAPRSRLGFGRRGRMPMDPTPATASCRRRMARPWPS